MNDKVQDLKDEKERLQVENRLYLESHWHTNVRINREILELDRQIVLLTEKGE